MSAGESLEIGVDQSFQYLIRFNGEDADPQDALCLSGSFASLAGRSVYRIWEGPPDGYRCKTIPYVDYIYHVIAILCACDLLILSKSRYGLRCVINLQVLW